MKPIDQMKNYNTRLKTALNELEVLEDYDNIDYKNIIFDMRFCVEFLEHRREQLQRRGRTQ